MEDNIETQIAKITGEDGKNTFKAMFLVCINNVNWALYQSKMDSYSQTIIEMNKCYNNISSELLKKEISSLVDYANNNYLNRDTDGINMSKDLDDIVSFILTTMDISKKIYIGATDTKDKCAFSLAANDAIGSKQLTQTDYKIMNKIYDCYLFSQYLKTEYTDQNIYLAIRQECIKAYSMIESEKGKDIILQNLPRTFLNIK